MRYPIAPCPESSPPAPTCRSTRLPLALIQGRKPKDGGPEKAVAYYDEDAVTMAVAAALDALRGFDRARASTRVYFASTSYELREKQGAALIAKALDLRRDVLTSDSRGLAARGHRARSRRRSTR